MHPPALRLTIGVSDSVVLVYSGNFLFPIQKKIEVR